MVIANRGRPQVFSAQHGAISIVRVRSDLSDHIGSGPLPQADAFSVITQLVPFEKHLIWHGRRLIHQGGHPSGALAIRDLTDDWRCHHRSSFDNVRFKISKQELFDFAQEAGRTRFAGLKCLEGKTDPIVREIAAALVLSLAHPADANTLLVDHLLLALQAHLLTNYGGIELQPVHRGGLSNRQLNLAKSFLVAAVNSSIGIADIAKQCGLSTSYFIRAFKATTGCTPHRWLLEYKADLAKQMLLGPASIAEIAVACGFGDQSHLTRIFTSTYGMSPGNWRREHRP